MPPRTLVLILIFLATSPSGLYAQNPGGENPYPRPGSVPVYVAPPTAPRAATPTTLSQGLEADLRDSLDRPFDGSSTAPNTSTSIGAQAEPLQTIPSDDPPTAAAPSPNYPPLGSSRSDEGDDADRDPKPSGGLKSLLTVISSLAIVLGLFFVLVWFMRRAAPNSQALLPSEVVEVLGRAPLSGRLQMQLLRVGSKLILLSVTPDGAETLTEVTDPDEVTRLTGACRQTQGGSVTQAFRQVLGEFAGEHSSDDKSGRGKPSEKPHA